MKLKIILPVIILLCGMGIAWALIAIQPDPGQPEPSKTAPPVDVIRAVPQHITLNVHAQGIIMPRTEIDLVPEVTGRITRLHPAFVTGDTFIKGDILITIDPRDYDLAITNAEAQVAEAKHRLALEEAESEQAHHEWKTLGGKHSPTPLMLREPQLAEARAKLKAAKASLEQARLQRSRCDWRAPFTGKIRSRTVGQGQYVQSGNPVARLFATDTAEVRLPLSMDQLNYLEWPDYSDNRKSEQAGTDNRPRVFLTARLAGTQQIWEGRIVRIDNAVDETTGLIHAVAEIRYPQKNHDNQHQLLPGLFVNAHIEGRRLDNIFRLPREAVNANRQVLLIDEDERIHMQPIGILRIETDYVLVNEGLDANDLVVASAITSLREGIKVKFKLVEPVTKHQQDNTVSLSGIAKP
ncbi:RND family efflux transporter, MFP subunit [Nitrosomonas marina]|uniref:RND family efflux transporter, MFP subunit n=1 Tax=Nitrosomonas marina TaxID=917 RepID=A0A1H9YNX9_9PROT|nr:efflux RND transporter periplasmic adaptor subunit [Nitrosomonas marina]SES70314.1 RND family efflux transporter, MFP subunit [Nitrosomonas marina]